MFCKSVPPVFWFNGALQQSPIAPVDLTDRGLTLGDGLFETSLVRNGRSFLRQAHLDRFAASAAVLALPFDSEAAAEALDALAESVGNGFVRLTLTRGGGARGLALPADQKPQLFGAAAPLPAGAAFPVIALATSPIRRNETSPVSRLKALPYLDAILGLRDAQKQGADDVLFENTAGHVACLSVANIFAVFERHIVTPPLSDGVLAGTVRQLILEQAVGLGFVAEERSISLPELLRADAVFATNSLRLLAPCRSIGSTCFASPDHDGVKRLQHMLESAIATECGPL
jgi:branched-chain amino acid aminotransferase